MCQLFLFCLPPRCCYSSLSVCTFLHAAALSYYFISSVRQIFSEQKKLFNARESRFLCKSKRKNLKFFPLFVFDFMTFPEYFSGCFFHLSLSLFRKSTSSIVSFPLCGETSARARRGRQSFFVPAQQTHCSS